MNEQEAIARYMQRHELMSFAPTAALIDMDGTLYDSMPRHADAWYRLISEIGIACERDEFYLYEGRTGASTINTLFRRTYGHDATPEQCAELYKRKTIYFSELPPVEVMPGAQEMVNILMKAGLTTVLVTGSGQHTLLDRLEREFPGAFPESRRITSHNVKHGKPHPEPYLKAMQLADAMPENSIAIDNAPMGILSGAASGAFTIGVNTGPIPEQDLWDAGADIVYPSMEELTRKLPLILNNFNMSI
jgi:HAD superfamily hydrolase (TIGR01509 family)